MMVSGKPKWYSSSSSEKWGMGLLVLFLDEDKAFATKKRPPSPLTTTATATSSSSPLLSKAQSTISICLLLLLLSLLLLSFSPSPTLRVHTLRSPTHHPTTATARTSTSSGSFGASASSGHSHFSKHYEGSNNHTFALQGLGTLFRRGNRCMSHLVVAHLSPSTSPRRLRLFLRLLHRSGITSRSDVVLLFPSSPLPTHSSLILQENLSFKNLLLHRNTTTASAAASGPLSFNHSLFRHNRTGDPLWGSKRRGGGDHFRDENGGLGDRLTFGSVVGFEAAELDPEDSLAGILPGGCRGEVPIQLRRWACYQLFLGRVRRSFKHVLLVSLDDLFVLRDVFARLKSRPLDSVHLWTVGRPRSSSAAAVRAEAVMGGIRSVRRLSSAVLMEIVRVATQKSAPGRFSDSSVLTHLVRSTSVLRKVKIAFDSMPDPVSVSNSNSNSNSKFLSEISKRDLILGRDENLNSILHRAICSSTPSPSFNSSVYSDC